MKNTTKITQITMENKLKYIVNFNLNRLCKFVQYLIYSFPEFFRRSKFILTFLSLNKTLIRMLPFCIYR